MWWGGLQPRERVVFGTGAVLGVVLLIWGTVWQPLGRERDRLQEQVELQRRELALARAVAALPATGVSAVTAVDRQGKSLLALVDASARAAFLEQALKRVEPVGARSVRASFEAAGFDSVIGWLEMLARDYRVRVSDLSVDKVDGSGLVSARITLEDAP